MKKCKFCAEDIQDAAIKCKHCGADLAGGIFKSDAKDVAQGIKKVSFDETVYKIGVFFSMVAGTIVGIAVCGASHNTAAGWISGIVVMFILGSSCYKKFLKK